MKKRPAIYIMTNKRNGTLYTGVKITLIEKMNPEWNDLYTELI